MINLKSLLSEQRKTNKKLKVLFIGDSQTAGSNSYARQLISSKIVNGKILAQRGASMSDIFNQFKSEYKPGKYDVISILGGNNDAGSEKFDTTSFNSIIAAAGNTPIILITAPTMEYINKVIYPKNYPSMHDIPRWQSSLASKTVRVINAYSLLDNKTFFNQDGLHLNQNANSLLVKWWLAKVKSIKPNAINVNTTSSIKSNGYLQYGDIGPDVKLLHTNLAKLNYVVGDELEDNVFGPYTEKAVTAFQQVNKLPISAKVDNEMFDLLDSEDAKVCPDNIRKKLESNISNDSNSNTSAGDIEGEIDPNISIGNASFSDSVIDQAYDMILPFEGFTPIAKKDSDGYCRIGHGSSHITKADGTIITLGKPVGGKSCAETYTYTINAEDAHRDLRRLVTNVFIPLVTKKVKQWGGDITKLNDATIATLVSVAYNYGHIPNELKAGIAASDMTAIGNALANDFNSPKSNPKRRKKEGAYILNSLIADPETDTDSDTLSPIDTLLNNPEDFKLTNLIAPIAPSKPGRGFGERIHPIKKVKRMHWGIDYGKPGGTPVVINKPGTCILSRYSSSAGNYVKIKHVDGAITTYMHFSKLVANVGDELVTGDIIGLVGTTGLSTGDHLHFEYTPPGSTTRADGASVAGEYFAFGNKNDLTQK